jgi:Glycosyl transferase family 2/Tetratricopeptide repeat
VSAAEPHGQRAEKPAVPDVSVVVRSIARSTLARTLASIAAQDGVTLEAIVVAACGASHPPPAACTGPHPLRFVASPVALARADAANAGMDEARGRYVTWLDDDDEWLEGHLRALVDAADAQSRAGVVHSLARVRVAGEPERSFGQPMALSELYQRNFIHMSTTLVRRELIVAGARCDPALPMHEDWDLLLQCAQRAPFHFVRAKGFVWYADIGASGAGGGRNLDGEATSRHAGTVRRKWAAASDALWSRLTPLLGTAARACASGDLRGAAAAIRESLDVDANNPGALALMSQVEMHQGRLGEAQAAATLATLVRPDDGALVYNLATVLRARSDTAGVDECRARLLRIARHDPRAETFIERLAGS